MALNREFPQQEPEKPKPIINWGNPAYKEDEDRVTKERKLRNFELLGAPTDMENETASNLQEESPTPSIEKSEAQERMEQRVKAMARTLGVTTEADVASEQKLLSEVDLVTVEQIAKLINGREVADLNPTEKEVAGKLYMTLIPEGGIGAITDANRKTHQKWARTANALWDYYRIPRFDRILGK